MFSRIALLAGSAAVVTAVAVPPAAAVEAPTTSEFVRVQFDASAAGACNFWFSGPSLDPSSTPYRITGNATVVSTRVIASTTIRCRLRHASTKSQVGTPLVRALPLNNSAVAGDILVTSFGPFEICTFIDAVFSDNGARFNPLNVESCRPLVRV